MEVRTEELRQEGGQGGVGATTVTGTWREHRQSWRRFGVMYAQPGGAGELQSRAKRRGRQGLLIGIDKASNRGVNRRIMAWDRRVSYRSGERVICAGGG